MADPHPTSDPQSDNEQLTDSPSADRYVDPQGEPITSSDGESVTMTDDGVIDTSTDTRTFERVDPDEKVHVEMSVTMDISDLDDEEREVVCTLARQYEDAFETVIRKNRDYSWSFLTTGAKLAASEGTPFDTTVRSTVFGLLSRASDKQERLIENVYGDGSEAVSDPAEQTALEAATYWQFISLVLGNPDLVTRITED